MNNVTYLHPAPWSPLPLTHPARAYTSAENTNVAETIAAFRLQHSPIQYGDDYDRVMAEDWLSAPGGFRA